MRIRPFISGSLVLATVVAVGACSSGGDREVTDTALASTDTAAATTGSAQAPAKDANHEFLRMMSDHHEGLIAMASAAMTKASKQTTQGDAHNLHTKQEGEKKHMVDMIQSSYGETYTPKVMPPDRAMNDSLQAKTGAAYDSTFYANIIKHHQEAVRMVDQFLPRLTNAELRQMAEKMRTEQSKEIEDFQRKMRG